MAIASVADEASGPTYSTLGLARMLGQLGEEVTLRSLGEGSVKASPGFRHMTYEAASLGGFAGVSPRFRKAVAESAGSADIVHSHGLWLMENVYPANAALRTGKPLVTSPRGTFAPAAWSRSRLKKVPFWLLFQRAAVAKTTMFHATSESEYRDIRRRGYRQPVCIVPNGVEIPAVAPKKLGDNVVRTLLYFGRIHPIKGIDLLIRAWSRLAASHPDWLLDIVGPEGEPGYVAQLEALAATVGAPRVRFAGPRYGVEKSATYQQASLCVLPSHTENFGMTVAEALAAGTPVVTTTGTPWRELGEKAAGWWVAPDVDALEACLLEAFALPEEQLSAMGARGRGWMEQSFAWSEVARDMRSAYLWLAEGGTQPSCVRLD